MKTSELIGPALDWAVAKCEGEEVNLIRGQLETLWTDNGWKPSTEWSLGGPIIERAKISVENRGGDWWMACLRPDDKGWLVYGYGPTPLIAAMRCYAARRLSDEVEIPEELLK
jgi:hypothetical protein